jgi:hypothetical protein
MKSFLQNVLRTLRLAPNGTQTDDVEQGHLALAQKITPSRFKNSSAQPKMGM